MMFDLRTFVLSLSLLSRFPVTRWVSDEWQPQHYQNALYYYPMVGLVFGLVLAVFASVMPSQWSVMTSSVVLVVLWGLLSGGLHLTSLANTVDAYFASHGDYAKANLVLQDPTSGPMAQLVLITVVILKITLVAQLSDSLFWPLVCCLVLSRGLFSSYLLTTHYAPTPDDEGQVVVPAQPKIPVVVYAFCALLLLVMMFSVGVLAGLLAMTLAVCVACLWRRTWLQLIGGFTGDTGGALVELIEVAVLFAFAVCLN